jgi:hypothetical protein
MPQQQTRHLAALPIVDGEFSGRAQRVGAKRAVHSCRAAGWRSDAMRHRPQAFSLNATWGDVGEDTPT